MHEARPKSEKEYSGNIKFLNMKINARPIDWIIKVRIRKLFNQKKEKIQQPYEANKSQIFTFYRYLIVFEWIQYEPSLRN